MARRALGAILGVGALVLLTGASDPPEHPAALAHEPHEPPDAEAPGAARTTATTDATAAGAAAKGGRHRTKSPCPADMLLVQGESCPKVTQRCLEWLPLLKGSPPRCARFEPNARCEEPTVPARFCIDRFEYPNHAGAIPRVDISFNRAAELCAARGRRLCKSREWTLACEGEERLPYPYGYARDDAACNVDRPMLGPFPRPAENAPKQAGGTPLVDWRAASGEMNRCVSPYGVHDMTGNVDEWVINESGKPYASGLKGGYWGPVRDRCRPMTTAHVERFSYYQIGFLCCADVAGGTNGIAK